MPLPLRRLLAWVGVLAAMLLPHAPASADSKIITTPPEQYAIAPGGVDMRTGRYVTRQTDLSIGTANGGLSLTRIEATGVAVDPFGNFSHNWDIKAVERRVDLNNPSNGGIDYRMEIVFDGHSATFDSYSYQTGYTTKSDGPVMSLTVSGDRASASAVYTFTAADGTVAVFRCSATQWPLTHGTPTQPLIRRTGSTPDAAGPQGWQLCVGLRKAVPVRSQFEAGSRDAASIALRQIFPP